MRVVPGGIRAYMVITPEGTFLAESAQEVLIGCGGLDEDMPEPFSAGEMESLEPGTSISRGPFRVACVMVDRAWLESLSVQEG